MKYKIADFIYDSHKATILKAGKEYKLTNIQNKLFTYLIKHPKTILSRQVLMEKVWERTITENSIAQFILVLRKIIEVDAKNPTLLVTHFGKGVSFEGNISHHDANPIKKKNLLKYITIFGIISLLLFIYYHSIQNEKTINNQLDTKVKKLLVLPLEFNEGTISEVEKLGFDNLLQSSFNNLDSEGEMIFDKTSSSSKQSIEKHWKIDKNLTVLHTNVVKNGEIYEAVIQLSNDSKIINKTTLKADNLNKLLQSHIAFIGDINQSNPINTSHSKEDENELFIKAIGSKLTGDINNSEKILKNLLVNQPNNFKARYELAKLLIIKKQYDESLAQLNTIKSTKYYEQNSAEIELSLAEIKYQKHENETLINDLVAFQANHSNISQIKKAKIKQMIAKAYLDLGDIKNSLKFYQQSIVEQDERLNPLLFAQSYFGQGRVMLSQSNDNNVFNYFEKSLQYSKLAGNIPLQISSLNSMSEIKMAAYQWDDAIALIKQFTELLELSNNANETAVGIGNLVALLNQRGYFSQALKSNNRLGKMAEELDSDNLRLQNYFYHAILAMNLFNWDVAQSYIDKHMRLAIETKNYSMQLNNAFILMELTLIKKDTKIFKPEWDKRTALIKDLGFERFQVYMDLYLARYYKQTKKYEKAIKIITQIVEHAKSNNDIKMVVDAHNQLAEIYLQSNAQKSLDILNNLEQYNPHPNPYMELKAKALNKLGKNLEALTVLNQAKLAYNESWTAESQALMDSIVEQIDN